MPYIKNQLPNVLSVRSITTLFRVDFSKRHPGAGESHDFCELLYIEEGSHDVLLDGTRYSLFAGDCIIYPPMAHHKSASYDHAKAAIISFELESATPPTFYSRVLTLSDAQRRAFAALMEQGVQSFCDGTPDPELLGMVTRAGTTSAALQRIKLQLELFLLDLQQSDKAGAPLRRSRYRREQFETLLAYMSANLGGTLTLKDLATAGSMSVSGVKLLFQEQGADSPMACFIHMKIEEAKRLMRETGLNVTQIAERLGFSSVHYFSRLFKSKTGQTPSDYLKENA